MQVHPFDQAIDLQPLREGVWLGHTHPAYAGMVGPIGGITTAQALQAVLLHPQRLGEPVALTVNFCAAVVDGAFEVYARAARTNRSTQHWVVEIQQQGQTVLTATAVTALRRETWGVDEEPMPACPPPEKCAPPLVTAPLPFTRAYEYRPLARYLGRHREYEPDPNLGARPALGRARRAAGDHPPDRVLQTVTH